MSGSGEACPESNLLPSCPPYFTCCIPPPVTLNTKKQVADNGWKKEIQQISREEYLLNALSNLIDGTSR